MAALISDGVFHMSSLKTGRLIFTWPLDSLWHCQPQLECLEPPDLSDLDDTDEEVDTELQSLSNPQSGEGKAMGAEWPIGLIASGHGPSLIVMLCLIHGMMP